MSTKTSDWRLADGSLLAANRWQPGAGYVTMSSMKRSEQGSINVLLVPFVLVSLLFIAAGAFAVWAYQSRQDYKNNSDHKVAVAVAAAKQQEDAAKDKVFGEAEKQPLKTYRGPEAYGSLVVSYPKTWSSYVDESGRNNVAVDGYFYPGTVPAIGVDSSSFALRLQIVPQSYSTVVSGLSNLGSQTRPKPKITPYSAPKVPSVIGVRVDGTISQTKTGSMIVLPLRDKTLELWTEAPLFLNDFNNNILPNFSFSP